MNPQNSEQPTTPELSSQPKTNEKLPTPGSKEELQPEKIAEPYAVQHQAPVPQATIPVADAAVQAAVALPVDPMVAGQPAVATTKQHSTPADDVDLIEKVWVDKAKKIVAQTRDDPYVQKNEISKVKAEYMGSRFGKKIKLSDDPADK